LSGTILFYGELSIIKQLGITPQYILRDNKNIHYIFLWTGNRYDFGSIARWLWGNIVQLTTQAQIKENKLFGDRITFINLPEYQWKTVHMVVETNNQQRLIRIDFKIYHKSKKYLIDMFK
jgi:hypothetical protein